MPENIAQAAAFRPHWPWRYGHAQTLLASTPLRRAVVLRWARNLRAREQHIVLDAGAGVRLSGCHTPQQSQPNARGLAIILHGWEGSTDSTYVLESGARLLADGWDVFRLNLRDHGGSHKLNAGLFHSGLIDEVVAAVRALARRYAAPRTLIAGFSLGGNFALRVALRAPAAGIALDRALAVCPVIDPAHSMTAMERGIGMYERYFLRRWGASLRRKQRAFPATRYFEHGELRLSLRELTRVLVERHTDYGGLDGYFDAYAVGGQRLAALAVPTAILTARDDPVIPIADFDALPTAPALTVNVMPNGGHCGFLRSMWSASFCSDWLAAYAAKVPAAHAPGGDAA